MLRNSRLSVSDYGDMHEQADVEVLDRRSNGLEDDSSGNREKF